MSELAVCLRKNKLVNILFVGQSSENFMEITEIKEELKKETAINIFPDNMFMAWNVIAVISA